MVLKSDNVEFVRIVAAILKMATGRNFSMSGINSGHHYLPTYKNFDDIGQC
jgi:major membrane immunogen (membrane-anchored lipoprotein)